MLGSLPHGNAFLFAKGVQAPGVSPSGSQVILLRGLKYASLQTALCLSGLNDALRFSIV